MKVRIGLLVILSLLIIDFAFGQGCSQCKLVAEQGSDNFVDLTESSYGSNINYGILFLMTVPYILLFALFHKPIIRFAKQRLKRSS